MEKKIVENYETRILGFPIIVKNVELRKFQDDWIIEVDWILVQDLALWALAHKPAPLTGNEVRFVRQYMAKTLKEFSEICEVSSHQSVMHWERKSDDTTGMNRPTEILLRARILDAVPDYIWERFESKQELTKTTFSKFLDEISKFKPSPEKLLSFFPDNQSYAYI